MFPHNKYTDLLFNQIFAHDDIPVMKYITSHMIRQRHTILWETLSQMYIRHRVTQDSVRPYRNNSILIYILIFLMQGKYHMLPIQTVRSKTETTVANTLSTSEPKQAESSQSDEAR